MIRTLQRVAPALCCALLFGCSSQTITPTQQDRPAPSWQQRQQQLLPLTQWQVQGKIRIQTKEEDTSANLSWSQHPDHYQIYLAGPLGQGAISIAGSNENGVTLDIGGEQRYQADSAAQLLQQQLGWSIPISQIGYWARGMPAPGVTYSKRLDGQNRLKQLNQEGWILNYVDYHSDQQPQLPRKIKLSRGEALKLTLILKQWQLNPPTSTP